MPTGRTHAGAFIRHHRQAVGRHRAGAVDHQHAGGVVKTQDVELGARRGVEDVGEGDLQGLSEHRHAWGLDGDVEGVLQHTRRQHVFDQCGRHGGNAHLHVAQHLAFVVHGSAGHDGQGQGLALQVSELRRSAGQGGGDQRLLAVTHRLQAAGGHARQVNLGAAGVGHPLGIAAHAAHHGVGLAGQQLGAHHHLREEHPRRCVGGRAAVHRHLDHPGRDIVEREIAVGVGVNKIGFLAQDVDLGVRNRQQEDVIGGVDHTVGAAPDVIESHRQQIRAGVNHPADQLGAADRQLAHRGERHLGRTSGHAVAIGIQESAVGRRADL